MNFGHLIFGFVSDFDIRYSNFSNLGAEEVLMGEEENMKVEVDQMKCGTVGLCVKECPEVFRFQEGSKKAAVIIGEIPPALQKKCRDAARKCPNAAITIKE